MVKVLSLLPGSVEKDAAKLSNYQIIISTRKQASAFGLIVANAVGFCTLPKVIT